MASISKEKKGYSVRITIDGKELRLREFTNKENARRFGDKLDMLKAAKKTGGMSPELTVWVSELEKNSPEMYDRLADAGLVDARENPRTLGELFAAHRESRRGVTEATLVTYEKIEANLTEFFGIDCELDSITRKRADDFAVWLRTKPLNRRRKGEAERYSLATVNRRINMTKQLFHYAKRIDWVKDNPFEFIKGGDSVSNERHYVPRETIEKVIEACSLPKWRAILALGRFAGVRGASEVYGLLWEHVGWSSPGESGFLYIKCEKTERYGQDFRRVPLHPIVERELAALFEQAAEKEPKVFPDMKKRTNFVTMTRKMVFAAGVPVWRGIWKNLRKSFCTDLGTVPK